MKEIYNIEFLLEKKPSANEMVGEEGKSTLTSRKRILLRIYLPGGETKKAGEDQWGTGPTVLEVLLGKGKTNSFDPRIIKGGIKKRGVMAKDKMQSTHQETHKKKKGRGRGRELGLECKGKVKGRRCLQRHGPGGPPIRSTSGAKGKRGLKKKDQEEKILLIDCLRETCP